MTYRSVLEERIALQRSAAWHKLYAIPLQLFVIQAARLFGRPYPVRASLFWGGAMQVVLPEPMSMALYGYGYYDEVVSRMFLDWIRPGDTVLDIGAHFGYFSLLAAELVGPTGQVHAFEPTPSTYQRLAANVQHLPTVVANNQAVHADVRAAILTDYGTARGGWNSLTTPRLSARELAALHPVQVEVACMSVDKYCTARMIRPAFIKIDAEGSEEFVIEGAARTISRCRPVIVMEVGENRHRPPVKRVVDEGYDLLVYDSMDQPQLTMDFETAVLGYKDVLLVPRRRLPERVSSHA